MTMTAMMMIIMLANIIVAFAAAILTVVTLCYPAKFKQDILKHLVEEQLKKTLDKNHELFLVKYKERRKGRKFFGRIERLFE